MTTGEIEDFLRNLKTEPDKKKKDKNPQPLSGRSKSNYRRAIGSLLGYAEARGYVPKGIMEMDAVSLAKEDEGDIEFFSVEEMKRILAHTEPALIPFMAIGAFAGLRHSEISRLDWREVRLEEGFIEVKARKTKSASRRLVPISTNLKAWLEDYNVKKDEGEVCPYASMSKQLVWIAEAVDAAWKKEDSKKAFVWKHNALRHSFITYRVAQVQNVAQVALESGNSPKMIFSHYRGLARPTEAEEWFGIMPPSIGPGTEKEEIALLNQTEVRTA